MTTSPHPLTFEVHHAPGMPYWVVERRHDGADYASTRQPLRCVAGPYLTNREAAQKADALELEAARAVRA